MGVTAQSEYRGATAVTRTAFAIYAGHERVDRTEPSNRGLNYGDGVFETMRVHRAELPLWPRHLVRLSEGAGRLGIAMPDIDFIEARTALAQQFSAEALSLAQAADLLWHAQQAGHSSDYLKVLYNALMTLDRATTLKAAECLNDPDSDWLCVATEPQTESFYQRRS